MRLRILAVMTLIVRGKDHFAPLYYFVSWLFHFFSGSIVRLGICAKNTPAVMQRIPMNCFPVKDSFRKSTPQSPPKTISRLRSMVASVAGRYFCPTACKVYATPVESMPVYKMGHQEDSMLEIETVSEKKARIRLHIPTTMNCPDERVTGGKRCVR